MYIYVRFRKVYTPEVRNIDSSPLKAMVRRSEDDPASYLGWTVTFQGGHVKLWELICWQILRHLWKVQPKAME